MNDVQTPGYAGHKLPVFAAMRDVSWHPVQNPEIDSVHVQLRVKFSKAKRRRAKFGFVDAIASMPGGACLCEGELCFSFLDPDTCIGEEGQIR